MRQFDIVTVLLLGLIGVLGLILSGFESANGLELNHVAWVLSLTFYVTLGWWVWTDAASRRIRVGLGSALGFLFCLPIFFTYYCFASRGRRGWILLLTSLAACFVYAGLTFGVMILMMEPRAN